MSLLLARRTVPTVQVSWLQIQPSTSVPRRGVYLANTATPSVSYKDVYGADPYGSVGIQGGPPVSAAQLARIPDSLLGSVTPLYLSSAGQINSSASGRALVFVSGVLRCLQSGESLEA